MFLLCVSVLRGDLVQCQVRWQVWCEVCGGGGCIVPILGSGAGGCLVPGLGVGQGVWEVQKKFPPQFFFSKFFFSLTFFLT